MNSTASKLYILYYSIHILSNVFTFSFSWKPGVLNSKYLILANGLLSDGINNTC